MKFFVFGQLWFEKTNGNTYHTAKIIDEKGNIYITSVYYGYEKEYKNSARQYIKWLLISWGVPFEPYELIDLGSCYFPRKKDINN